MRLAVDSNRKILKTNVKSLLENDIKPELKKALEYTLENWNSVEEDAKNNVENIKQLLKKENKNSTIEKVIELQNYFIQKSVWAIGGDGWAYDIGYGGLDHVLASNRNINILVLDTEVYSNTGGQSSKASQLGVVAKFAESGKKTIKKDLGKMAMSYGYVYVASVAMGSNKNQLLKAFKEAEAYDGPSLIIAYSPCIAHGIDMTQTQQEEKLAVDTGYWITYRYNPLLKKEGKNPLILDSKEPKKPVEEFFKNERRYESLKKTFPENVKKFRPEFDKFVKERYNSYKKMSEE
jgi:pyruvate-ferredoxin/flavodoxin oxidoreductase